MTWTEHVPGQRKIFSVILQSYNAHSMYLQGLTQVTSTREIVTTQHVVT